MQFFHYLLAILVAILLWWGIRYFLKVKKKPTDVRGGDNIPPDCRGGSGD